MVKHKEAIEKALETWIVANDMFEDYERKAMEAAIIAYLDTSEMAVVPKEATDEMIRARFMALGNGGKAEWDAMLDAAPDPFKEACE